MSITRVKCKFATIRKSIRRLLEAKRACIGFELHENSLQTSINKRISCL